MIDVSVRGDQRFAFAERKIELANEIDHVVHGVFVADVEEGPLLVVVDQVRAAGNPPPRLVVEFDNVREEGSPFEHKSGQWAVGSGQYFSSVDSTGGGCVCATVCCLVWIERQARTDLNSYVFVPKMAAKPSRYDG